MGLRPLAEADWIEVDEHRDADLAEKRRLLRTCPEQVVAVVDDPDGRVRAASEELLGRVVENLAAHHSGSGAPRPPAASSGSLHPVDAAGRLTQEDWCVHLPDPQGRWRLVAASVCFPTRWDLRTKIGRTIREIHSPVPLYDEQLAGPMDRYFARMRPEQAAWRLNWNLLDDPTLHQPTHRRETDQLRSDEVGERMWLRVERQTLRKLPATGAIVFGIRVHQDPLASLRGDPAGVARLAATIDSMPEEVRADKGLADCAAQVLQWARRPR
jgi:hypothetical protein